MPLAPEAGQEAQGGDDDEVSQRQLIYELRYEIDRAILHPGVTSTGGVARVIYRNQRGVHAKYVLINLSKTRVSWLVQNRLVDFTETELNWLAEQELL